MSCFIVNQCHIDALVNALVARGLIEVREVREVGQLLWDENFASYNDAYPTDAEDSREYVFEPTEGTLWPIGVLKAAGCYAYQACEHDGWESSRARALVEALKASILDERPGWGQLRRAPWDPSTPRPAYTLFASYDAVPAWEVNDLAALTAKEWDVPAVVVARSAG